MARPQNGKRHRVDDLSQEHPPNKKIKSRTGLYSAPNFRPEFWDSLSRVWLTRRYLRELDRRNSIRPSPATPGGEYSRDLARFARHGGPDLHHLRGCPEPNGVVHTMVPSPFSASSQGQRTQSRQSEKTTTFSSKKRSSPYDQNFEQHLVDHQIYPDGHQYADGRSTPEPRNIDEIRQRMAVRRVSLSPSRFSEPQFRKFKLMNARVVSEGKVMSNILPMLCGDTNIPNEGSLCFNNPGSMTTESTVDAVPDFFDGARPGDIDNEVKSKLNKIIIPTKHAKALVAPNFFLEAKAPRGGADVAKRQITLDLAIGDRSTHAVQNYGYDQLVYDGNAYTYGATYHAGTATLQVYSGHVTAPITPGGRPEYHTTQLNGYMMTGNRETCVAGASALRNIRELAQEQRNIFIQMANAKARTVNVYTPSTSADELARTLVSQQDESSASDGFVDRQESTESQDVHGALPFPHFQQGPPPDSEDYNGSREMAESTLAGSLYAKDNPQAHIQPSTLFENVIEPSRGSAMSFGDDRDESPPKRHKSSHGPPSRVTRSMDPARSEPIQAQAIERCVPPHKPSRAHDRRRGRGRRKG